MVKIVNIKWKTDDYDISLPTEFKIPEEFIDEDQRLTTD